MTDTAPPGSTLDAILARTRHLLLDFDGPICSIFAGLPAATVADRLRKLIPDDIQMPGTIANTTDPLEVFAYSATISDDLAARVEAELTEKEITAVATAQPTPYVHEVVTACHSSDRSLAVVSNNSARAVHTYLTQHGLDDRINLVIARTSHDPDLLKPNPHLIERAVDALEAAPSECTLVGDSITDIEGARLANVQSIGYANKAAKSENLGAAGADAVIASLAELALGLRRHATDQHLQGNERGYGMPRHRRMSLPPRRASITRRHIVRPSRVNKLNPMVTVVSPVWGSARALRCGSL